jgi:hypothetical protein
MNDDELVRSLTADLAPVRRLPNAGARTRMWASVTVACVALGTIALGVRADFVHKLTDLPFLAENALLFAVFATAAWNAFQLSVPGASRSALARSAPALAFLAWLALVVARRFIIGGDDLPARAWPGGLPCVWRLFVLSIIPAAIGFVMLRRAAPHKRGTIGSFALLSAGALAMLGTQVVCAKDDPAHVFAWHIVPLALVAVLGVTAGRALLRQPLAP